MGNNQESFQPIELKDRYIKDLHLEDIDVNKQIINKMFKKLNQQFEEVIIESLKSKGFEFDNKIELEEFIKARCRCEDFSDINQKIYYIDDIPFLLHKYETQIITDPKLTSDPYKVTGSLGTYSFL